jgi:hypothetical protein
MRRLYGPRRTDRGLQPGPRPAVFDVYAEVETALNERVERRTAGGTA